MHTAHTLAKWIGKYAVLLHWSDPKLPIKVSYEELQELLDYIQYMEDCLCDAGKDSPWISVKDKLPEEDDNYLVYGASYLGSIINGSDYFDVELGDWWEHPHDQITHWMSLPKPPESED